MRSGGANVLVLGASGMLGNAVLRYFAATECYRVVGSIRSGHQAEWFPAPLRTCLVTGYDVLSSDGLAGLFGLARPDVVINCVGIVKQLPEAVDPLVAIPINALLPHRLAKLCELSGARLIHISTDCVFTGLRGAYRESDPADADDLYGRSKFLGEVDYPHAVTLRTSIIGHELRGAHGLLGWFLAQHGSVHGYTRAIFSGLPTVELARIIHDLVLPSAGLRGVYHVSAAPIAKYDVLKLFNAVYARQLNIVPDERVVIDRSLDATRFRDFTGYSPPPWPQLVRAMHEFG